MAGLGFKDFAVGEVLTSADVDGYLMQQTVMRFADSGARGSALGTAVLAEGMVSYLDDTNEMSVYTGSGWSGVGVFSAATAITATNASWPIPTLANPIVRVTVVGGGGGGGGAATNNGSNGNTSTFACSAGTATASGGVGGDHGSDTRVVGNSGVDDRLTNANGGNGGHGIGAGYGSNFGEDGLGGGITVAYLDLTGVSTANVTCGAGGAGGVSGGDADGGDGGDGFVIFEYRAA